MAIASMRQVLKRGARNVLAVIVCLLFIPAAAFSLSLDEAKAKGLVGEQPSGYLGVVTSGADAAKIAQEINAKRRERYQQIAAQNGTAVAAVEALAGQKAIESTPAGQYIQSASGAWIKK